MPEEIIVAQKLLLTWQRLDSFFHVPALFLTLMMPLLGTAGLTAKLTSLQLLALLCVGINIHIFAYVLNDFIDLPVDRTQPARSNDPLVLRIIRPWQALFISLIQLPIALALTLLLEGNIFAILVLGLSFTFVCIYDIWGKRCFFPPLTDLAQGLSWASLALFGAIVLRVGPPMPITWVVCAFILVFFVMSNGVHGSLKDLGNDLKHHRRTTAIFLGARPGEHGVILSLPLKLYACLLQILLIGILLIPLTWNAFSYDRATWYPITITAAILVFLSLAWPLWAIKLKREKSQFVYAALLQLGLLLIALLVICAPLLQPMVLALLIAIYLIPLFGLRPLRQRITRRWSKLAMRT